MNTCYRCNKEATYKTKAGKWVCDKNASKCDFIKQQLSDNKKGKPTWNTGTIGLMKSWNTGLTKDTSDKLREMSENFKLKYASGLYKPYTGIPKTTEGIRIKSEKLSNAIKKRYEDGWMPKAGRCKKIKYESDIAGMVLLDGSWELLYAQYLDKHNINWRRNTNKFDYVFEGKHRKYTPDFYLPDIDLYVEVKGYTTHKDEAKWNCFTEPLCILYKRDIDKIKKGEVLKLVKRAVC